VLRFESENRRHRRVVRHLSAYLDGELPRRQHDEIAAHLQECVACRAAWDEIRKGARVVLDLERTPVPPMIWADVARAISESREEQRRKWTRHLAPGHLRWSGMPVRLAFVFMAAVVAAGIFGVLPSITDATLSADEFASRSDRALAEVLQPGQVLYRRWQHQRIVQPASGPRTERNDVLHTWIDGSNMRRTASRLYSADGRLFYSTVESGASNDEALVAYFTKDNPESSHRDVVVTGYTPADRQNALSRLPADDQQRIREYLGPSYRPLIGEMRFNRQLLQGPAPSGSTIAPRIRQSLERGTYRGEPVAIIRTSEPNRVWSEYRPDGTLATFLADGDLTRYISRKTYLTLRLDAAVSLEDGRRVQLASELVELRPVNAADLHPDPFQLQPPVGTKTRHLKPDEALQSLAAALRRAAQNPTHPISRPE
jgi:hypothetical protein